MGRLGELRLSTGRDGSRDGFATESLRRGPSRQALTLQRGRLGGALKNSRRGLETDRRTRSAQHSDVPPGPRLGAQEAIREHAEAKAADDHVGKNQAARDLVRLGEAERPFAGCVRAVAEQDLGLTWRTIEELASGA